MTYAEPSELRAPAGFGVLTIEAWLVSVGDHVREGDPIVVLTCEQADMDLPASTRAQVGFLHGEPGDEVSEGGLLAVLLPLPGPAPDSPGEDEDDDEDDEDLDAYWQRQHGLPFSQRDSTWRHGEFYPTMGLLAAGLFVVVALWAAWWWVGLLTLALWTYCVPGTLRSVGLLDSKRSRTGSSPPSR